MESSGGRPLKIVAPAVSSSRMVKPGREVTDEPSPLVDTTPHKAESIHASGCSPRFLGAPRRTWMPGGEGGLQLKKFSEGGRRFGDEMQLGDHGRRMLSMR